ncbi:hypothetical protein [Pseudomonas oryzihabitans]|nr:hypothetical protein [Pseudomonas oryzihabitans]
MLGVFALAVIYAKGWVFAHWKPSMVVQFVFVLFFLFLMIAALYNATHAPVKMKPSGPSSVASTQLIGAPERHQLESRA